MIKKPVLMLLIVDDSQVAEISDRCGEGLGLCYPLEDWRTDKEILAKSISGAVNRAMEKLSND